MRTGIGLGIGAIAAMMVAAAAVWSLEQGWLRLLDPPLAEYPVQGLDVSHHQGPIDWEAVADTGRFRFVWIKATEGGDFVDPRFREHWRGAREAGLVVGAYHFFTLCRPGRDQAENLLRELAAVGGARLDPSLPVAVDLELGGNCARRPSTAEVLAEVHAFLATVARATGRKPVVYTTYEFHRAYLVGAWPTGHPLWIRSVFTRPAAEVDGEPWVIWQYLPRGRVPGIEGVVDQNAFAGDADAFATFTRAPPGP